MASKTCPRCSGGGKIPAAGRCWKCNGRGSVADIYGNQETCWACHGSGTVTGMVTCPQCQGSGTVDPSPFR